MALILEKQEKDILIEILKEYLNDLQDEIHHTDDYDFKETLKRREKLLVELLYKIQKEISY